MAFSLLSRLKLEGKHTKADVVLGLDTNLTANAEKTDLFAPHDLTLTIALYLSHGLTKLLFLMITVILPLFIIKIF